MKLKLEMMIQQILPSVRSFVAKELVFQYKLSQTEAAELLGITQPAISQYLNNVRGNNRLVENKAVLGILQNLTRNIYERKADETHITAELLRIYTIITGSREDSAVGIEENKSEQLTL